MGDTGGKSGRRPGRHLQVEASGPANAASVEQRLVGRSRRGEVVEGCAGVAEGRSKRLICLRRTWMEDTGGKSGRRPGRHLQVEASGPGGNVQQQRVRGDIHCSQRSRTSIPCHSPRKRPHRPAGAPPSRRRPSAPARKEKREGRERSYGYEILARLVGLIVAISQVAGPAAPRHPPERHAEQPAVPGRRARRAAGRRDHALLRGEVDGPDHGDTVDEETAKRKGKTHVGGRWRVGERRRPARRRRSPGERGERRCGGASWGSPRRPPARRSAAGGAPGAVSRHRERMGSAPSGRSGLLWQTSLRVQGVRGAAPSAPPATRRPPPSACAHGLLRHRAAGCAGGIMADGAVGGRKTELDRCALSSRGPSALCDLAYTPAPLCWRANNRCEPHTTATARSENRIAACRLGSEVQQTRRLFRLCAGRAWGGSSG